MKILLTGVTGQLGHTLQQQLSGQHEVINASKMAILAASLLAGVAGFLYLYGAKPVSVEST